MKTLEWTIIDKKTWGEGPWQNEPDKRQWQDEERLARQLSEMGD